METTAKNRFTELNKTMENKLREIGLPATDIKVFGVINCNIHIHCLGRETAEGWHSVLHKLCSAVKLVETTKHNKVNTNTCLLPSRHKEYLIGGVV